APLSVLTRVCPVGQKPTPPPKHAVISPGTGAAGQLPSTERDESANFRGAPGVTLDPAPAQNHVPGLGPSIGMRNRPVASMGAPSTDRSLAANSATWPWVLKKLWNLVSLR